MNIENIQLIQRHAPPRRHRVHSGIAMLPLLAWAASLMLLSSLNASAQANLDTSGPDGLPGWITDVGAHSEPTGTNEFAVVDYGAVNDGTTLCTTNIQAAIDAAHAAGGGVVTFSPGSYLTGSLFVKDNVHLRIDSGVTILGSENIADYPEIPTRVAGVEMNWPAALINVNNATNVLISGDGTIDGQGAVWWALFDDMRYNQSYQGHPYATDLRWALDYDCKRPRMMVVADSTDVTIRNLRMNQAGFWTVQILYSQYVTADGLVVRNNSSSSRSTDGVNVDSSTWVLVQNCDIANNDDCICMKSGRDWDGLRVNRPTTNVVIRNNITYSGHGSISFGSETSGGIKNIVAYGNRAVGTTVGVRFKSTPTRGGTIENLLFQNNSLSSVPTAFLYDLNWYSAYSTVSIPSDITNYPSYWDTLAMSVDPPESGIPTFRNMTFRGILTSGVSTVFDATGLSQSSVSNIVFQNLVASGSNMGSLSYCSNWDIEMANFLTGSTNLSLSNCQNINVTYLPSNDSDGDGSLDTWETDHGGDPYDPSVIPPSASPSVTVVPFISIAESGIDPSKTYTHAISGGAARTVNGVAFSALTSSSVPPNFTWTVTGGTKNQKTSNTLNAWTPASGGLDAADQQLIDLLGTLCYASSAGGGDSQSYVLSGLTPGQWYDLRLYIRTWDPAGVRPVNLLFTNGSEIVQPYNGLPEDSPDLVLNNGNADSAYYLNYRYQAQGSTVTIDATTIIGYSGSFHFYALTNEQVPSGAVANAPASLKAVAVSMNRIDLSWTTSSNAASYIVKRAATTGGPYSTIASGVAGTTYSDTDLTPSTHYYYTVSAVNTGGSGPDSGEASAMTLPGVTFSTTNLFVASGAPYEWFHLAAGELVYEDRTTAYNTPSSLVDGALALRTGNDDKLNSTNPFITFDITAPAMVYIAYDTRLSKPSWMAGFADTGESLTSDSDTAVLHLWSKAYPAGTVSLGGNQGVSQSSMYTVMVTENTPVPDTPNGLTASPISSGQIDLSWTMASNAVYYSVKRASTSGGPYTLIAAGLTGTNYSDTGLTEGTPYYYMVSALNSVGESADSAEAHATTPMGTPPNMGVSISNGTLSISWPSNYTGWQLEYTTNLLSTNGWIAVPGTEFTNALNYGTMSNNSLYFRLVNP